MDQDAIKSMAQDDKIIHNLARNTIQQDTVQSVPQNSTQGTMYDIDEEMPLRMNEEIKFEYRKSFPYSLLVPYTDPVTANPELYPGWELYPADSPPKFIKHKTSSSSYRTDPTSQAATISLPQSTPRQTDTRPTKSV